MRPDDELRDAAALIDILLACGKIERFVTALDLEAFRANEMAQSAVRHELLIVGEATKRLSATFRARHDGFPWSKMAGMRDRLIHRYDVVRIDIVWSVAASELGPIAARVATLLRELGHEPPTY